MKKHLTFSLALLTIVCSTVTAQLPSYLPADGLVAWYPFNGNANDESGNGNDGVVNGACTLSPDRNAIPLSAYLFPGNSSSYITMASPELLKIDGEISVAIWIYMDGGTMNPRAIEFGNGSSGYRIGPVGSTNNDRIINMVYANSTVTCTASSLEWHHLVMTVDSNGTQKSFLDGSLIQTNVITGSLDNTYSNEMNVGRKPTSGFDAWGGLLDDIAIYNRALTPQEIQNLYTGSNETVDTGDGAAPLPQGIPYQAAARDAQGQVIADAPVNVRFSLHEGVVDGAVSYSETHALTTNSIGLFNTVFGNGTPEQSVFDNINWAATTKFLQVEIDLGDGYVDMGTTQLLSVPYAFRSDEAARIKNAGLPIFADNAAALAGGLVAGEMYRTATGDLKIVY
jgi:hypothetical protein